MPLVLLRKSIIINRGCSFGSFKTIIFDKFTQEKKLLWGLLQQSWTQNLSETLEGE